VRIVALVLAATALAGCGTQIEREAAPSTVAPTTTTTIPAGEVGMVRLLVRPHDLGTRGYQERVAGLRFAAVATNRIHLCGVDLREEKDTLRGRQSRFVKGDVELAHVITVGGDADGLVERFGRLARSCPDPWTEPELPIGGGLLRRRVTGVYPLPALPDGLSGASAIIRSTNRLGASDTIVVVLARGTLLSSLSVTGPIGADFSVIDPAIQAAARRLGQTLGSP